VRSAVVPVHGDGWQGVPSRSVQAQLGLARACARRVRERSKASPAVTRERSQRRGRADRAWREQMASGHD
jgi:hypothetical protein